ncbi:M48 family metallopeptidase [Fulvivirgaceae bacterium BMA12]|uniref:M48 family metallopeptidase n=1 Tax=Agaribacillus aureus TaxID=3051825 RepID=A0ABT8LIA5_9BACT|nr:M48 family metallopeptidase [Fulvivirgaceae bacterium BMA12]
MNEHKNIEKDYRKWVLFNNLLGDFQNLYELYTSVDSRQSKGGVSFHEEPHEGGIRFNVVQEGNNATLELNGEGDRKRFLEYLVQLHFPNQEIEEWYQTKVGEKEKSVNHSISGQSPSGGKGFNSLSKFSIHSKESKYYNIRVFFSVCFYFAILGFVVSSFLTSVMAGVMIVLSIAATILLLALLRRIGQGFFIGVMKGSAVKINEQQYPEIFQIVKNQAKEIGLAEIPEVYVSSGHFNAFVTRLARKKYLMLYSEVIETALKGDFEILKFIVGHELGHLKRRHLNKETWLAPSSLIPFLRQAHSRACEYTCDRIGHHFSKQGSVEGILILATGKEIHSKINIDRYIEDANSDDSFWVWFSEKFLSHPYTFKRLSQIKKYEQVGY